MLHIADHFLLRIAGLPTAALDLLKCERSLATARELEELESRLTGLSTAAGDGLYQMISGLANHELRRALLNVKRAVHNRRLPARADWDRVTASVLDEALQKDLAHWMEAVERYLALVGGAEEVARADLQEVRARLRGAWAAPEFQTGLLLSQPMLYRRLLSYLDAAEELERRERQVEKTALAYFYRMVTKTSPFSTFTGTAVGNFAEGLVAGLPGLLDWESHFSLNAAIVERLSPRLAASPYGAELPVRVNETALVEGDFVHLLRARPAEPDGVRVISLEESVLSLRRSGLLDAVLSLVAKQPGLSSHGLVRGLHSLSGGALDVEQLTGYVKKLQEAGLLLVMPRYDAADNRALLSLARAMPPDLQARSIRVVTSVEGMASQSPAEQDRTLVSIRTEVEQLFSQLGGPVPRIGEQGLVHHDCLVRDAVQLPVAVRDSLQPDLARLSRLMPLFNPSQMMQQAVRSFFMEHYGADRPPEHLVTFYRHFNEVCYGSMGEQFNTWDPVQYLQESHAVPGMRAASELREAVVRSLLSLAEAPGCRVATVPVALLDSYGEEAEWLRSGRLPLSVGYFGQLTEEGQFVVNQVVPGFGTYMARFGADTREQSARQRLTEALRKAIKGLAPGDEVAELIGIFGFNGQIHPHLTARGLVYPGESNGNQSAAISWAELGIQYNRESDCPILVNRQTGQRVIPLNAGPLSPHLTPPFFRFLSSFGPALVPDFALLDMFEHLRAEEKGTRHYARLQAGKLVLLRETWCIPHTHLPEASQQDGDFQYFHRLRAWARELGLPRRVFVVPQRLVDYLRQSRPANNLRRLYKPFFVDFDDLVASQMFRRFTEGLTQADLTVTEMLPLPEQTFFRQGDSRYVTELLLELYETGGEACG